MYLREFFVRSIGPIRELDVSLELASDGTPKPLVFVGKNGTGKTIALAYMLDSLAELAKNNFGDVVRGQRVGHMPFLKTSSGGDSRSLTDGHLCLLEYRADIHKISYIARVGGFDLQTAESQKLSDRKSLRSLPGCGNPTRPT